MLTIFDLVPRAHRPHTTKRRFDAALIRAAARDVIRANHKTARMGHKDEEAKMQTAIELREPDASAALCAALNQALADTAVATMLAQNLHWNVTGPTFLQLHDLYQQIYEDHFQAQDDLAERTKALEGHADGHLGRMLEASTVKEHTGDTGAIESLAAMLRAEEAVGASLKCCETLAAECGDTLTEDLCIARRHVHGKFAWILRSHLR